MEQSLLERKAFITALVSLDGVGARTVFKILKACQKLQLSLTEFWDNKYQVWQKLELSEKTAESIKKFKKEHNIIDNLSQLETSGIQVVTFEEKAYPKLLAVTEDLPALLFVKSQVKVGSQAWRDAFAHTISMVGTRKITSYGRLVINELVPPLVNAKQVIVSGFMYGVDAISAQVALAHQGSTIAVLGYGFNYCFPTSQKQLMQNFLEKRAIFLSEFPPTTMARAANFVIRNRIVAGLSRATVVVEAAKRSGSHITANYANNYGRLVMAVPGPITNPFSEGTKDLINQGAILVRSAQDILSEMAEDYGVNNTHAGVDLGKTATVLNREAVLLLENLSFYPELSFESLQKMTKIDSLQLNQLLFDLEIKGKIGKKWGKYCLIS